MTNINDDNGQEIVQLEVLCELKDILEDEFPMLVTTYLDDANDRLQKLRSAIDGADATVVRAEAHSLKGSSINLGATSLASLCAEMENRGHSAELDDTPALFERIASEFSRTEEILRTQI